MHKSSDSTISDKNTSSISTSVSVSDTKIEPVSEKIAIKSKTNTNEPTEIHFFSGIKTVSKQINPDFELTSEALNKINELLNITCNQLVKLGLKESNGEILITANVQTAVRSYLPGQLGKHAVSEGIKFLNKCFSGDKSQLLFNHDYGSLVSDSASIYLSGVIEYLAAEIIELSTETARKNPEYENSDDVLNNGKRWPITLKNVEDAIRDDGELSEVWKVQQDSIKPETLTGKVPIKIKSKPSCVPSK